MIWRLLVMPAALVGELVLIAARALTRCPVCDGRPCALHVAGYASTEVHRRAVPSARRRPRMAQPVPSCPPRTRKATEKP